MSITESQAADPICLLKSAAPDNCDHAWREVDSQSNSMLFADLICERCKTPGERNTTTGDVFYPAT